MTRRRPTSAYLFFSMNQKVYNTMNMGINRIKRAIVALLCTLIFPMLVLAQTGSLTGVVVDGNSGETIIGATVRIEGTSLGTATDLYGRYMIQQIPEGVYTVSITYIGYETVRLADVIIRNAEREELDVVLRPGSFEMDAITVAAYRETNSISAVLFEIQRSRQVISGVSAQQMSRIQDSNAAEVMRRVPGITIAENRFVIIRGLDERYNQVMINNVIAPSTEVDKRSFSFDLISSSSLDRMMIYKSGSSDLPGDFAGGVIKLYTVDHVDSDFVEVRSGFGFRNGTTGRSFLQSNGSGTDFIGFDNGYRKLPSGFPDSGTLQGTARNSPVRIDAAHTLPNNFQPNRSTALADYSAGVRIGQRFPVAGKELTTVTSVDYSTGYQSHERNFFRYYEWENREQPILSRFEFVDQNYELENRVNLMSNWRLRFSPTSRISFRNMFNQIGQNETIIRNGFDFIQRPDDDLRNYMLGYRSRTIYTGQLEGDHQLTDETSIRWVAGGSYLRESEPDLRRFRTFQPQDESQAWMMQLPPSSNLFDTGRYYGSLDEFSLNQGMELERYIGRRGNILKAGYQVDYRDRNFTSRYFSYLYPGFNNPDDRETLIRLPLDEIFQNENVRTDAFIIEEGTRPIDSYQASSLNSAGYLNLHVPFERIEFTGGVRLEYNVQRLSSRDDFEPIEVQNPVLSLLPFVNTAYSLSDITRLRLAYGRTVNRPEFRELAPFVFYDYKLDGGRFGNPDLKHATIDNVDLRMEFYPRVGETISLGGFFKYFTNPIENKTSVTTESPQFGYVNADYAVSYGIEAEIQKSFRGLTTSRFLDRISVNANASMIFTEVDMGTGVVAQEQVRPLQGQSPYIINTSLYYEDTDHGLTGTLAFNRIGPRIFSVGDVLFPTIYEMPRNSLDVMLTWQATTRFSITGGIQDLLNAPYQFYQDSDRSGDIDMNRDHPISTYRKGQVVSFGVVYRL